MRYGANTMEGIPIITKKGAKVPVTTVTTFSGENNTQNLIFNHGGANGHDHFYLACSYRGSHGMCPMLLQ